MVSKYFEIKTASDEFKQNLDAIFEELKDKKVLLYGAGEGFEVLDKKYNFKDKLNITGIADLKFEKDTKKPFRGLRKISPNNIPNEAFDVILVTNEYSTKIIKYLKKTLRLTCDVRALFVEEIEEEQVNLNFLYKHKFDKTLPKLIRQCKGKKVVLYGAGKMLELINKYFDLSGLDIIAVADKRFEKHQVGETFLGWNVCSPQEINNLKPDLVLLSIKFYIAMLQIIKSSYFDNIKVKPLITKSFFALMREVWGWEKYEK